MAVSKAQASRGGLSGADAALTKIAVPRFAKVNNKSTGPFSSLDSLRLGGDRATEDVVRAPAADKVCTRLHAHQGRRCLPHVSRYALKTLGVHWASTDVRMQSLNSPL